MSLGTDPGDQAPLLLGDPDLQDQLGVGDLNEIASAVEYASSKGVAVIVSAGYESSPLCETFAWIPGAMCAVGADRNELKGWYSNMRVNDTQKAVAAPGGTGIGSSVTTKVPACRS